MKQYLDVVRHVLEHGSWTKNRTKYDTISVPGMHMRFDLQEGFPAVTTKKLAFKSATAEILGYMRGYRSAADFRALGTKTWDANANENQDWLKNPYRLGTDDIGSAYGVQFRTWPAYKVIDPKGKNGLEQIEDAKRRGYEVVGTIDAGVVLHKVIDQVRECLDKIMFNPSDRRIIFHSWNVAQLEEMALPSCPTFFQFHVNSAKKELSLNLTIRSADLGLGTPFNCASAAVLVHLVARLTGLTPRFLSVFLGDAHIYANAVDMLQEQLKREPLPLPRLVISETIPEYAKTGKYEPEWIANAQVSDFSLDGYQHYPNLTTDMAI